MNSKILKYHSLK